VDLTADRESLTVVVTGKSVEVPIESQERGSFGVPICVLFKIKRISGTYEQDEFRVRFTEGKFRIQGMSVSHPLIAARKIARRVIDIPEEAIPRDILSLPLIFSMDEIEDCGLHVKVLEAQKRMADDLNSAYETLNKYGFNRNELSAMANLKIKAHADAMKHVLFSE
jgi:hypothetical protein